MVLTTDRQITLVAIVSGHLLFHHSILRLAFEHSLVEEDLQ